MVSSNLVSSINYPETRKLDGEDVEQDVPIYEITIKNIPIEIAVGQAKFTFIESDIVYFPVYLIKGEEVTMQIGVYEIFSNQQPTVIDAEGDIDVNRLGNILLYSFVSSDEIQALNKNKEDTKKENTKKEDTKKEDMKNEDMKINEETYSKTEGEPWIQTFMQNNNFQIVDNEGGGDCLFAAVRDGLASVGIHVSIEEMRKKVAVLASEDTFEQYNSLYQMTLSEQERLITEINKLAKSHKDIVKRAKATKDRDAKMQLLETSKDIAEKHALLKNEKKLNDELHEEFNFMKNIDNLEQLKTKIQTSEYWADSWAITTLEQIMNIKLIIFSEQAYTDKDIDNVLQCGEASNKIESENSSFKPTHYIMVNYIGEHYQLITYKEHGAFTFKELPWSVKKLITDKCLERQAGAFHVIPEFREHLDKQNIVIQPDVDVEVITDLYDDNTVFQFYDKSRNAKPGKGSGEKIRPEDIKLYAELATIKDWRKKLSNFWTEEFDLDGHKWKSVEHYYQASKFKNTPDFYKEFTLDNNPKGKIANDPNIAKAAGSKTGKYDNTVLRPKEIKIDTDFFSGRNQQVMEEAMMAKFTQNDNLRKTLLATRDAKLQHFVHGSPPVVFDNLMRVRAALSTTK